MAAPSAIPLKLPFSPPHYPKSRIFPTNCFNNLSTKTSPIALNHLQNFTNRNNVPKSLTPITPIHSDSHFNQVGRLKNHSTRRIWAKSSYSDSSITNTGIQTVCVYVIYLKIISLYCLNHRG